MHTCMHASCIRLVRNWGEDEVINAERVAVELEPLRKHAAECAEELAGNGAAIDLVDRVHEAKRRVTNLVLVEDANQQRTVADDDRVLALPKRV